MKKLIISLFLLFLPPSALCAGSDEILDTRIAIQSIFPRQRGWCHLPWKGRIFTGTILRLYENSADVKIMDTDVHYVQWPVVTFSINDLLPVTFEKCSDSQGLIASLKESGKLKSASIETAMQKIDRAWFCPLNPYYDTAIEIGHDMFISSPHMHILSLELCRDLFSNARSILDIGSGSGYLCAMFAELAPQAHVVGVEYYDDFITEAKKTISDHLPQTHVDRIEFHQGDGEKGYAQNAPYDIIYVGFMCTQIPQALIDQLACGGRLLIPVGQNRSSYNEKCLTGDLYVVQKLHDNTLHTEAVFTCSFVPSLKQ